MNIVISPHPDDEIIGVHSLIKQGLISQVIYIDPTPERLTLAKVVGNDFGFGVDTLPFKDLYDYLNNFKLKYYARVVGEGLDFETPAIKSNEEVHFLVPDSTDNHPLHKAVNSIAKVSGCKLGYYSVDMDASFVRELSAEESQEKLDMLGTYYPDQADLWKYDWKYFLFEGVVYDAFTSPTSG